METNGFMPGTWHSRDFEMVVSCKNKDCFLNNIGRCVSPSSITIDSSGRCEMYLKEIESRKKEKK